MNLSKEVRDALGMAEGYILDWRFVGGCQLVNYDLRRMLTCPFREAVWRCEVIGPHTRHRWSDHLIAHERLGNGYTCSAIGDGTSRLGRTPLHVVGHGPA